jgi:hypothetical protein
VLAAPPPPAPAASVPAPAADRYAKCLEAQRRVRWDLDRDLVRGRALDLDRKFLPDGLSRVGELAFLKPAEARFLSQVQARTYANLFDAIERAIGAKTLERARAYGADDAVAREALARFADEHRKHEALFRGLARMAAEAMPPGYAFVAPADAIARETLAKSTWAVLALALDVGIATQAHYRASLEHEASLSALWSDVFLFHWKEESQHAIVAELEWRREHGRLATAERDRGVDDLIALLGAIDAALVAQARADAAYFLRHAGRAFLSLEEAAIRDATLKAYRWQHVVAGVEEPRYLEVLRALTTPAQMARIAAALEPVLAHVAG